MIGGVIGGVIINLNMTKYIIETSNNTTTLNVEGTQIIFTLIKNFKTIENPKFIPSGDGMDYCEFKNGKVLELKTAPDDIFGGLPLYVNVDAYVDKNFVGTKLITIPTKKNYKIIPYSTEATPQPKYFLATGYGGTINDKIRLTGLVNNTLLPLESTSYAISASGIDISKYVECKSESDKS
jgi:hypothetical protein